MSAPYHLRVSRLVSLLCVLCMLTTAAVGAEQPTSEPTSSTTSTVREYAFELQTLNSSDRVRRGRAPFSGAAIEFNIASAMTDEELESVKDILDELGASQPDDEGYRSFSMSNGTRVRIGGFVEDPEVAGVGVEILPVAVSVKDEFSTTEAALVLRIVAAGNLFVGGPADSDSVATPAAIADKGFHKRHKNVSVTPDERTLAEWVRQNIPARDAPGN